MSVSNTLCGATQGLLVIALCEKEQDVAAERANMEVGQHFSGINVLVLDPGQKQNTYSVSAGMRSRSENGLLTTG